MIQPRCPLEWGSCRRNWAQAYLQPKKTLRELMFMTVSQVFWVISCTCPWFSVPPIPALLAMTSSLPPTSTDFFTRASISVPIVTLVCWKMPLPSPYRRQITSCVGILASSASKDDFGVGFKSAQTTNRAPCDANASEMARPRPEEDPVTMQTLSCRR